MTPIRNADLNHDGVVDATELAAVDQHNKIEIQTRITVASFICMVITAAILISGLIPEQRITALNPLLSTLMIAFAGIIGAYFGMTGWMSKK
jgi:intracellular septation protein A